MNSIQTWVSLVSEVWGVSSFDRCLRALDLDCDLIRLGSEYGGWVVNASRLRSGLVISAGVGEDVSFEIEVLRRDVVDVLAIDPTPRAKIHLCNVAANLGSHKTLPYGDGGRRSINEYDLAEINRERFFFCDAAIAGQTGSVKLYFPKNTDHVSMSCMHNSTSSSEYLVVPSLTVGNLMSLKKIDEVCLLKLDVEGAEIETLSRMLDDHIFPTQICVEFDAIRFSAEVSKRKVFLILSRLKKTGYEMRWVDSSFNCLLERTTQDALCAA